jgi:hypothetical protein
MSNGVPVARDGAALDGFFASPYLLWFVAENPVLNDRLPANTVDVIAVIVAAVRRDAPGSLREQLDSTLRLVCWSGVAARCGVQLAMIDALIDAGAPAAENPRNALVEAGADVTRPDSAWNGTPLGWARHYVEDAAPEKRGRYAAIASYLGDLDAARRHTS